MSDESTSTVIGNSAVRKGRPSHGGSALRRIGSLVSTLALIALGLAGGLWLGSPASAATPPLKVDMLDGNGFNTNTLTPLLTLSDLAPGGSKSGTMNVLDNSDSAVGSGLSDAISLKMINPTVVDGGPVGKPLLAGSGAALSDALSFTVSVTSTAGTVPSPATLTVAGLTGGAVLATGLVNGDIIGVTLTATLPDRAPALDNQLQYGQFSFDLELVLDSTTTPSGAGGDSGAVAGGGPAGTPPQIEVQDTGAVAPSGNNSGSDTGNGIGNSAAKPGNSGVLVLGENKDTLSHTGASIGEMSLFGGVALVLGVGLLLAARRRSIRITELPTGLAVRQS